MSSGEERLLAGVPPTRLHLPSLGPPAGHAGARRAVGAVGLGSGVRSAVPRFINRRHLRGEGQGASFRKVTEGPGEALFSHTEG